jgi:hypothetical protein
MASNGGITRIPGANIPPVTQQQTRAVTPPANQGAGRREIPNQQNRQIVNVEGKELKRNVPRGTYLNIIV